MAKLLYRDLNVRKSLIPAVFNITKGLYPLQLKQTGQVAHLLPSAEGRMILNNKIFLFYLLPKIAQVAVIGKLCPFSPLRYCDQLGNNDRSSLVGLSISPSRIPKDWPL